jgi:hypothetical protein
MQYYKTEAFTIRLVYQMIVEAKQHHVDCLEGRDAPSNYEGEEACWKKLWKLRVSSNYQFFALRLAWS